MTKPPAFQFYASDFLASTVDMTATEVGGYVRLLASSWERGPLPKDEGKLARTMQVTSEEFSAIWPAVRERLTETSKGYINKRLEVERKKQTDYREKQANKGRASAQQRFNRGSTMVEPEGQPETGSRLQPEGNSPSPSPSSTSDQKREGQTASAEPSPVELLAVAWNELTSEPILACKELSQKRTRAAQARLKERPVDDWRTVIQRIQDSTFCQGQNDRGWVATFDWLLQPDTAVKVLEGKYDNRASSNSHSSPPMLTPKEIRQMAHNMGSGSWASECIRHHDGQCGGPNAHRQRTMRDVGDFAAGTKAAAS